METAPSPSQAERSSGDTHPPPLNTTWEWPSPRLALGRSSGPGYVEKFFWDRCFLTSRGGVASEASAGKAVSCRCGRQPASPPCAAAISAEGSLQNEKRSKERTMIRALTPFPGIPEATPTEVRICDSTSGLSLGEASSVFVLGLAHREASPLSAGRR